MRQALALVGVTLVSTVALAKRCDVAPAFAGTLAEARLTLEAAFIRDQQARKSLEGLGDRSAKNSLSPEEQDKRVKVQIAVDKENLALLDGIVCKYGWPKRTNVGELAAQAAFLIVQHAALPVQEQYVTLLKAAVETKEADAAFLATLEDRINVRNGRPQQYGSQLCLRADGRYAWRALAEEDEAKLDAVRASIGLGSIKQYAAAIGAVYAPPSKLGCQ